METECYEFISDLMIILFKSDHLITYDYLAAELHISRTMLSAVKRGKVMKLNQYLRVIVFIMGTIHLTVMLPVLLVQVKKAITTHSDLMIATVPHQTKCKCVPQDWMQLTRWDDA